MDVKPGYKQTEAGFIPEEWTVSCVGDSFAVCNQLRLPISQAVRERMPGPYPYYGPTSVQGWIDQYRVEGKYALIGEDGDHFLKWQSQPMTLLVRGRFNVNNHAHLVRGTKNLTEWFYWFFANRDLAPFLTRQGAGRYKLTKAALLKIPIALPPLSEQRMITRAVSDIDALLETLDRLIAKKRDLKQAAMQQLLTGQTRLPGFHGEWEVKRVGNAFTIYAGKSKSAYVVEDGDYWVCDMGSVSTEGRLIVSKRTNYRGDFLKQGDLIMPKDDIGGGNIIGKVGYIDANDTYILGDHVYCLRALEGDPRFLAYAINSHRVNAELRKKVIGSAQLGLGRKSVNEQEIQFPQTPEQTAIAEVLTEMDAELAALEQRREKTRALKQAMMQELLTGKTRLV